jgi:transcriptional regulator of acetoin/glycerol metabolism
MNVMVSFAWPGNIRQLRNAMRYSLAVCDNNTITCADLPADVFSAEVQHPQIPSVPSQQPVAALPATPAEPVMDDYVPGLNAMEQAERQVILEALQKHKWHVSKAVKEIGISRATMYRKMEKYAIVPPNKR